MSNYLENLFNVSDKTVVITGANGFFGQYITKTFVKAGAKTVLLSRADNIFSFSDSLKKEYNTEEIYPYQVDFYNRENLNKKLLEIINNHDVDVVINNAYDISPKTGFNTKSGSLEESDFNCWQASFESGIYWIVLTTQLFGNHFSKKKHGSFINITSMYAHVSPNPNLYKDTEFMNPPSYSVAKAGILAFTRYVASYWGKFGIRANTISPGPFSNTENQDSHNAVSDKSFFIDRLKENTSLKRIGHPTDLSGALIYLASNASSYMTGQALIIDGGWTIT